MKEKNYFKLAILAVIFSMLFVFSTCKIGLGESVDTQPPTTSITYPPATSIIRGAFVLQGTATDETALKDVTISFEKKVNGAFTTTSIPPIKATVDFETEIWRANLNVLDANGYPLEDGEYKIIVVAEDQAKRTTDTNIVYTIDNTPPILVLTQPATVGEASEWKFGSELNFTGLQYDVNLGEKFKFKFYDVNGELIDEASGQNPLSNWTIDIGDDTDAFASLKASMTDPNSACKYWFDISVQDLAYVYTNPDETEVEQNLKTGNESQWYYSYSQITNLIGDGERTPKINELYDVENLLDGSSSSRSDGFPVNITAETLKALQIARVPGTGASVSTWFGNFSINPNNITPTVEIDGLSASNPAIGNQISLSATLRISIAQGLNNSPIDNDTIKYTIKKKSGSDFVVWTKNSVAIENQSFPESSITDGTTKVINYTGPSEKGEFQIIIDASDKAGKSLENNTFNFIVNEGAPTLKVRPGTSATSKVLPEADGNFKVLITGTDDGDTLNLKYKESSDTTDFSEIPVETIIPSKGTDADDGRNTWTWTLSFTSPGEGNVVEYIFLITDGKYESSEQRAFTPDTTVPSLASLEKPTLKPEGHVAAGKAVVSQRAVTVKGYTDSTDTQIAQIAYTTVAVAPGDETTDTDGNNGWKEADVDNGLDESKPGIGFSANLLLPVDEDENLVEGEYYVWVRFADDTYDEALANISSPVLACTIIADSNDPEIAWAFDDDSVITSETNGQIVVSGDFALTGYFSDSYKELSQADLTSSTVKAAIEAAFNSSKISEAVKVYLNGIEKDDLFNYDDTNGKWTLAGTEDGLYSIEITLTDWVDNKTSETIKIFKDNNPPVVTITNPTEDGEVIFTNTPTLTGTATDAGSGVATLKLQIDSNGWVDSTSTPPLIGTGSWIYNVANIGSEGEHILYVWANDEGTNQTGGGLGTVPSVEKSIKRTFYYDASAPDFNGATTQTFYTNNSVTLSGTIRDTRGLKSLTYIRKHGTEITASAPVTGVDLSAGPTQYSWSLDTGTLDAGTYEYEFSVTDLSNRTTKLVQYVEVDKTKPGIEITSVAPVVAGETTKVNGIITIRGNITEDAEHDSRVATGTYSLDCKDGVVDLENVSVGTNFSNWILTIDTRDIENGKNLSEVLSFNAVDLAGNVADYSTINALLDDYIVDQSSDNPIISFDTVKTDFTATTSIPTTNLFDRQSETLNATVSDDDGIQSITLILTSVADSTETSWTTFTGFTAGAKSFNLEQSLADVAQGIYSVSLTVVDNVFDKETTVGTFKIGIDDGDPVLTINEVGTAPTASFTITGKVKDDYKLASFKWSDNADDASPTWNDISVVADNSEQSFSVSVTKPASGSSIKVNRKFVLTDSFGKETTKTVTWDFDVNIPTIAISSGLTANATTYFNQKSTLEVAGTAADDTSTAAAGVSSGLNTILYNYASGHNQTTTANEWKTATGTSSWTANIKLPTIIDGAYTLFFKSTDNRGNESEVKTFNVTADSTDPVLNINTTKEYETGIFDITGSITETNLKTFSYIRSFNGTSGSATTLSGSPWTISESSTATGTYKYDITAIDEAGNSITETKTVKIDAVKPTVDITVTPSKLDTRNQTFTFRGSASDAGAIVSGISKVEYSFDGGTNWTETNGTDAWSILVDFSSTFATEGGKTIKVRATDNAGNVGDVVTEDFVYDSAIPTITITGATISSSGVAIQTGSTSEKFKISGTAFDKYGVASIKVTQTKDDGTAVELPNALLSTTAPNYTWSIDNLPRDPSSAGTYLMASGKFTYTITVTDSADNTSNPEIYTMTIDLTPPDVNTISSPSADLIDTNALTVDSYTFRGTTSDVGVGSAKIWYVFEQTGMAPDYNASTYTELAVSNGVGWNIIKDIDTGTNASTGNLCEGTWYLHVIAEDKSGNRTTATTRRIDIDKTAPSLTVIAPTNSKTGKKGDVITVSGTATDTNSLTNVVVKLNGTTVTTKTTFGAGGSWSFDIPNGESDGQISQATTNTYEITVIATDKMGRTNETVRSVYYDVIAPTIETPSVSPTVIVNSKEYVNGTITITGRVTDEDSINSLTYTVNGSATTISKPGNSNTNWAYSFTLNTTTIADADDVPIVFVAKDRVGNTSTITLNINVDQETDKPVITLSNASFDIDSYAAANGTANVFGKTSNNQLIGMVTDDDAVSKLEISTDNGTTWRTIMSGGTTSTYSFTETLKNSSNVALAEGEYTVVLRATDKNNLLTTDSSYTFWIAVDEGAPVFSEVIPAGQNYYSDSIAVSGKIADSSGKVTFSITDGSGANTSSTLSTSQMSVSASGTSFNDTVTSLPTDSGTYTKTYTATDKYGYERQTTITYFVDTDKPNITSSILSSSLVEKDVSPYNKITVVASDVGSSGMAAVYYARVADGATKPEKDDDVWVSIAMSAANTYSADIAYADVAEGSYDYYVAAKDNAGNWKISDAIDLVVDATAPTVVINTPTATATNTTFTVSATVTDTNYSNDPTDVTMVVTNSSGTTELSGFTFTQGSTTSNTSSWTSTAADLAGKTDGVYTINVTAKDKNGRTGTASKTITWDTTAPVVTIISPTSQLWNSSNTITISGTGTDSTGISKLYYRDGNSGDYTEIDATASWSTSTLIADGKHTYYFYAKDTLENVDSASPITHDIWVDTAIPNLTDATSLGAITSTGFTLQGTVSDPNLDKVTIAYNSTPIEITPSSGTWSKQFVVGNETVVSGSTKLVDGTYTFTIKAEDSAGKTREVARTVQIDTVAPVLQEPTWEYTDAATIYTDLNSTYSVSGTASDATPSSGVGTVWYALTDNSTAPTVGIVSPWTKLTGTESWRDNISLSGKADGTYYIHVYARDNAGLASNVKTRSFKVDTAAPTVAITAPTAENTIRGTNFTLTGTVTGADAATAADRVKVQIRLADSSNSPSDIDDEVTSGTSIAGAFSSSIDLSSLADAKYTITVTATDLNGRTAEAKYTFTRDATAPAITFSNINSEDPKTVLTDTNPRISGQVTDTIGLSAIKYKYQKYNGSTFADVGTEKTLSSVTGSVIKAFTLNMTDDLSTNATDGRWKVIVTADDQRTDGTSPVYNTSTVTSNEFIVDRAAPALAITNMSGTNIESTTIYIAGVTSTGYSFKGTATDVGGITSLVASVTGQADENVTITNGTWSVDLAAGTFTTNGTYNISLTATDVGSRSTTKEFTVYYDTEKPVMTISSITPYVVVGESRYVNDTVTIKGTFSDNDKVSVGKYTWNGIETSISDLNNWTLTLSTTGITSNASDGWKDLDDVLSFVATDRAGNEAVTTDIATELAKYTIDQTTDKPVVAYTSMNANATYANIASGGDYENNLFGIGNTVIRGTITDDDGIASVKLTITPDGGTAVEKTIAAGITGSTSGAFEFDLNAKNNDGTYTYADGKYTVEIIAKDNKLGTENTPVTQYLVIDRAAPILIITQLSNSLWSANADIVVSGTFGDAGPSATLTATGLADGLTGTMTGSPSGSGVTSKAWTYTITKPASGFTGGGTITFTAADAYNRTTAIDFVYRIDNAIPTISDITTNAVTQGSENYLSVTATSPYLTASGTAADTGTGENVSGISKVQYTTDAGTTWTDVPITGANGEWASTIDFFTDRTDGTSYTVTFRSVDGAGNYSTTKSVTFHLDNTDPAIYETAVGESLKYTGSTAFSFAGTATDTNNIASVTYTVSKDNSTPVAGKTALGGTLPNWTLTETWNAATLTSYGFSGDGTGIYEYVFTAKDNSDRTKSITRRISLDNTAPVVNITSVTTQLAANGKTNNVNGNITISGTITDNNSVSSGVYTIESSSDQSDWAKISTTTDASVYASGVATNFTFTVNTRDSSTTGGKADFTAHDDKYWRITVTGTDAASHTTSDSEIVYVDSDTDKPVITLNNASATKTASSDVKVDNNLFETSGNNKILATISDDDGITSVVVNTRSEADKDATDPTYTQTYSPSGNSTYSLTHTLPSTEGLYTVEIIVTDNELSTTNTTGRFWVGVDAGAPELNITTESGRYWNSLTVTGTAKDASGTIVLSATPSDATLTTLDTAPQTITGTATAQSWSDVVTMPTATDLYTITYIAKDKYERETSKIFTFNVDTTAPVFAISAPATASTTIQKESITAFSGTASDSAAGDSGLAGIYYTVLASSATAPASVVTSGVDAWTMANGATNWSANIDFSSKAEGEYKVYLAAVDNAGNTTSASANYKTIIVDAAVPNATITIGDAASGNINGTPNYRGGAFTLSGAATDTYFDSASLTVSKDGGAASDLTFTTGGNSSGNWTYSQAANTTTHANDGTYVYTLTVTDRAGRVKTATATVIIDTTAPTLEVTNFTSGDYIAASSYTFRGIASDNVQLNGTGVQWATSNAADAVWTAVTSSGISWTHTIGSPTELTQGTTGTLYFRVADTLGNTTTSSAYNYTVDWADPTLTITAVAGVDYANWTDGTAKNSAVTITGTALDASGLQASGGMQISFDGGSNYTDLTVNASNVWTHTINAPADHTNDGTKNITLLATDACGRTTEKTLSLIIDTTVPTVSVTWPYADAKVINSDEVSTYAVSGTAADALTSVQGVFYAVTTGVQPDVTNAASWTALLGTTSWTGSVPVSTTDATYTVYIFSKDIAGNASAVSSRTFVADNAAPTVTITTAANAILGSTLTVAGTTVGASSATATYASTTTAADDQTDNAFSFAINLATAYATDGVYTVVVNAKDANNRTGTASYTFTRDTTAPVVTYTNITADVVIMDSVPKIYGSVTDNIGLKANATTYQYQKYDGSSWNNVGDSKSLTVTAGSVNTSFILNMSTDLTTNLTDGLWRVVFNSEDQRTDNSNAGNKLTDSASVQFRVDRAAPTINFTTPADNTSYAKKGATVAVVGTSTDVGGLDNVVIKVGGTTVTTITAPLSNDEWSYTIPASNFAQDASASYVITAIATDKAGRSLEATRNVFYDVEAPVLTITAISPVVGTKVNGTITIQGTISDNDVVSTGTYTFDATDSANDKTNVSVGNTLTNWSFTVNTTHIDGNSTLLGAVLSLAAADRAGNAAVTTAAQALLNTYTIDQTSDKPVITLDSMTAISGSDPTRYLLSSSEQISATITDDDGIASTVVAITSGTGSLATATKPAANATSGRLIQPLTDLDEGEYTLTVTVTDNANAVTNTVTILIAIDNSAPEVVFNLTQNEFRGNFELGVTATDSSNTADLTVTSPTGVGVVAGTKVENTTPYTITTDNTASSPVAIVFTATDKYGRTTAQTFTYKVDLTEPTLTITTAVPAIVYVSLPDSPIYQVSGTAADASGGSGLKDVRYVVLSGSGTAAPAMSSADWLSAAGISSWKASIDMTGKDYGDYTAYICARDNSDNYKVSSAIAMKVDANAPELSDPTVSSASVFKDNFTINGTVSDTEGNVDKVTALYTGGTTTTLTLTGANSDEWTYTVPASTLAEGSYVLTITAYDKSGKTDVYTKTFVVDRTAPSVSYNNINANGTTSLTETAPKVYGALSDTNGISTATILFKKYDSSTSTYIAPTGHTAQTVTGFTAGTKSLNFTVDMSTMLTTLLTDGIWQATIAVTDVTGNTQSVLSGTYRVDRNNPEVAISSVKITGGSEITNNYVTTGNNYTISGTMSDVGGISTVAVQLKLNNAIVQIGGANSKNATLDTVNGTWTVDIGDVFSSSGTYNLVAIATDNAGRTKEDKRTLVSDNTAPVIQFISPFASSSAQISNLIGSVTISGKSIDDAMSSTQYAVGGTLTDGVVTKNVTTSTVIGWTSFSGVYDWSDSVNTTDFADAEYATQSGTSTIWTLPVHIKAMDVSGNTSYATLEIKIDTDGDKPVVEFLTPSNGATVGGQFQVTGTATDNTFVNRVYMQVQVVGANYTGNVLSGFTGSEVTGGKDAAGNDLSYYFTKVGDDDDAWYLINGTTGWNYALNKLKEFDKENLITAGVTFTTDEQDRENYLTTTKLIVKVKALDTKTNGSDVGCVFGYSKQIELTLQSGAPSIVENDMPVANQYISGTVNTNFTVTDDEGISSLNITLAGTTTNISYSQVSTTATTIGGFTVTASNQNANATSYYKTWTVTRAWDTTSVNATTASFTIEATDYSESSAKTSANTRTVYIDNTAPVFNLLSDNTYIHGEVDRGSTTDSIAMLGESATINGDASDAASGMSKVILYFTQTASETTKIFTMGGTSSSGGVDSTGTTLTTTLTIGGTARPFPESSLADIKTGKTNDIPQKYIVIDKAEGGNDTGDVGDQDGYNEHLSATGTWYAKPNSTNLDDGVYDVHCVAVDKAGNVAYKTDKILVQNHKPIITSIDLYTDIDLNGTIENTEKVTVGFGEDVQTDFVVRNNLFQIGINATVTNGSASYDLTTPTGNNQATSGSVITISNLGNDSTGTNDKDFALIVKDILSLESEEFTFSVTYKNTDNEPPVINLFELNTDVATGTAINTGSISVDEDGNGLGHIEVRDTSTFNNTSDSLKDPDVSGTIILRGRATDNQRLTTVKITLGGVTSTILTWSAANKNMTAGTNTTVVSQGLDATGHEVEWAYTWDTSTINDGSSVKVALLNATVAAIATDAASQDNTTTAYAAGVTSYNSMTVDVVPYITKVTASLSNMKKGNPSVYDRTALGHYPIRTTSILGLEGYNLNGAVVKNAAGVSQGDVVSTGTTVTVPAAAVANLTSGNLLLTVNGISVLNNENDNTVETNQRHNGDNNNLLTDDVVLDVWKFNSQAARPISGIISDPVMKISPTSGMLGFAFTNGPLYFSMPGKTATYSGGTGITNQEYSYVYWQGSYDFMSSVGLAYDSAGHTYGCAAGGDINSNSADRFSFMTDRWGVSGAATDGSYGGTNALRLEAIGQRGDSSGNNTGTLNFDKTRIKSPSYATYRSGSSTNIYLAYFDNLNGEIRFRYGNLKDTQTTKANFNNFNDAYRNDVIDNRNNLSNGVYDTTYVQVIANEAGVSGTSLGYSGEYLSLGTTSTGIVVLVWYDSTNGNLMYAYNDTPTAGTTGKNKDNWSSPKKIFEGAGEYCQLTVDAGDGIHIAAYDGTNGDLKYAYLSAYNAAAPETCTVDSYAIVGQNITIDVARESAAGKYVPHIGYYALSSALPKYAYLVSLDDDGKVANGVDDDECYTGNWEITLVPTESKMTQDRINVGVWKNAGVITTSTTGTSSVGQYYGKCYGNGTSNAVLAYAIKPSSTSGYIETAQKQ